jgi:hypothetical protein
VSEKYGFQNARCNNKNYERFISLGKSRSFLFPNYERNVVPLTHVSVLCCIVVITPAPDRKDTWRLLTEFSHNLYFRFMTLKCLDISVTYLC